MAEDKNKCEHSWEFQRQFIGFDSNNNDVEVIRITCTETCKEIIYAMGEN